MYKNPIYFIAVVSLTACASYIKVPCGTVSEKLQRLEINKEYVFLEKNNSKIILTVKRIDSIKIEGTILAGQEKKTLFKSNITDISKSGSDEPIIPCNEADIHATLHNIVVGKVYQFQLKEGDKVKLRVEKIVADTVYGEPHLVYRYLDSQTNKIVTSRQYDLNNRVSVREIVAVRKRQLNPGRTFLLIIPLAVIADVLITVQPFTGY